MDLAKDYARDAAFPVRDGASLGIGGRLEEESLSPKALDPVAIVVGAMELAVKYGNFT